MRVWVSVCVCACMCLSLFRLGRMQWQLWVTCARWTGRVRRMGSCCSLAVCVAGIGVHSKLTTGSVCGAGWSRRG